MRLRSNVAMAVVWPSPAALIQPLAQELPYAAGVAIKRKKKKKKKNKRIQLQQLRLRVAVWVQTLSRHSELRIQH